MRRGDSMIVMAVGDVYLCIMSCEVINWFDSSSQLLFIPFLRLFLLYSTLLYLLRVFFLQGGC